MRPINILTSTAVPLPLPNIDTDQIIPKQFLKRIERTGYGDFLFYDWRYDLDAPDHVASPTPTSSSTSPTYKGARDPHRRDATSAAAAPASTPPGPSTSTASSPSSPPPSPTSSSPTPARTASSSSASPKTKSQTLIQRCTANPNAQDHHQPRSPDRHRRPKASSAHFDIDPFRKYCLLNGLDDIGLTLRHEDELDAYESKHHDKNSGSPPNSQSTA